MFSLMYICTVISIKMYKITVIILMINNKQITDYFEYKLNVYTMNKVVFSQNEPNIFFLKVCGENVKQI